MTGLLENAWYVRTSAPPKQVKGIFGDVSFVSGCKEEETVFITAVMNKKQADMLLSEIPVLSLFRMID